MSVSTFRSLIGAVAGFVMSLLPAARSAAEDLAVTGVQMDGLGRLVVAARMPAGFRHAVLEIHTGPEAAAWRSMIAGQMDGRSASVIFRLPLPAGFPSALARIRAGAAVSPPTVELSDPDLFVIGYDPAGGPISEDVKLENLSALMRKRDEWSALPAAERDANLIAHATTLPRVSGAGFSSLAGTVYINYPDGDASVIIDNRHEESAPPPIVAGPDAPAAVPLPLANLGEVPAAGGRAPRDDPPQMLPQSNEAICAFALESRFPDSTPQVAGWLGAAGYSVRRYGSVTVDDLISWGNRRLGVLFWQSHSGSLRPNDASPDEMCIVTGQQATVALSKGRYKTMRSGPVWELLLAKRPDVANPANTDGIPIYAITRAFITNHMRGMFAPHSLFAFDTCTGADPDLANLFLADGAGALISWNNPSGVSSGVPFRQLFDRLLGRNAEAPRSTPNERPFRLKIVETWMQDRGFFLDPSPTNPPEPIAQLVWSYHSTAPAYALLPSIFRILQSARTPQYDFTQYLIEGDPGKDPGPSNRLVSWGNTLVQILDWQENGGILIKPPPPPYPVGDIQVIIGNHVSNRIPLTEWTIPFTYTLYGQGTLQYKIELSVKLRADVHRFRILPEEATRSSPIAASCLADCTGRVSASGQYKPNPNTTITWSGGSTLRSYDPLGARTSDIISCGGVFNLTTGAFDNSNLFVSGTFTQTDNGTSTELPADLYGFFLPPLPLTMDLTTYTLPGKSVPSPFPPDFGESAVLEWPTVQPSAAPAFDTPR